MISLINHCFNVLNLESIKFLWNALPSALKIKKRILLHPDFDPTFIYLNNIHMNKFPMNEQFSYVYITHAHLTVRLTQPGPVSCNQPKTRFLVSDWLQVTSLV